MESAGLHFICFICSFLFIFIYSIVFIVFFDLHDFPSFGSWELSKTRFSSELNTNWISIEKILFCQRSELVAANLCSNSSLESEPKTSIHPPLCFLIIPHIKMAKNEKSYPRFCPTWGIENHRKVGMIIWIP